MEEITDLHHDICFFLIVIIVFVSGILGRIVHFYAFGQKQSLRIVFSHHSQLEKIGTYVPALILLFIAQPSFALLYTIDEINNPSVTVKVIGRQGYWVYETTDMLSEKNINFESYMVLTNELSGGTLRLLEVDKRLTLPVRTPIRILVTAQDVLHSGAVPALGVKMDACPGRLNQVALNIDRCGTYYGQCSELCGINHSFMPIAIDAVTPEEYTSWLKQA